MSKVPGYYTPAEAAAVLHVSVSQVSRYISDNRLTAIKLGHQILIEQSKVHQFEKPPRGNPNFRRQTA